MKKSVRINLLVITTVVAVFAFAGIWYLRPGVPNELIEQARERQLQPLLEIEAPLRKPVSEPVSRTNVDKKALAEELLPSLTEQVSRSIEGNLYEKLKKEFISDEAFVSQISSKLGDKLTVSTQVKTTAGIPQELQADFTQQMDALRSDLLSTFAEEQGSFFSQVEGMLDSRLDRIEKELTQEMQAYVPQMVDKMIPSLVEMLVKELEVNKKTYLPQLAAELKPYLGDGLTEEELVLLYSSYRDRIVADLVPAILSAMEAPAREEVAGMVKEITTTAMPVAAPVAKPEPPVVTKPVTPPAVFVEAPVAVPKPPVVQTPKREVIQPEPILTLPLFPMDEPEVFVDPVVYEEKRTEIRTKAIQDVLDRINSK